MLDGEKYDPVLISVSNPPQNVAHRLSTHQFGWDPLVSLRPTVGHADLRTYAVYSIQAFGIHHMRRTILVHEHTRLGKII